MIDATDIESLKEIFVTRRECDEITDGIIEEHSRNSTALAVIQQQIATITWVSKTTLAAVISVIVGTVLKLVFVG